jgi:hypothetical protein
LIIAIGHLKVKREKKGEERILPLSVTLAAQENVKMLKFIHGSSFFRARRSDHLSGEE